MSISKDEATLIYKHCQRCINELNSGLIALKSSVNQDDFNAVRGTFSEIMGELVNACEIHVYSHYPEIREYILEKDKG